MADEGVDRVPGDPIRERVAASRRDLSTVR